MDAFRKYTKDELLTIVMIYWVNGNIIPSQRYYKEFFSNPEHIDFSKEFIEIPVGLVTSPSSIYQIPPEVISTYAVLKHFTMLDTGGRFLSLEEPMLLANDIINFVLKIVPEFDFEVLV